MARRFEFVMLSCLATWAATSACADRARDKGWEVVLDWSAGYPFDTSRWNFETGFQRNEELQYYAGQSPKNFAVTRDGLRFTARNERIPNAAYRKGAANWRQARAEGEFTSASIVSKDAWENVRIEIVANVRGGKGAWPAIWLKSENERRFGEVDLMEQLGREPDIVHSTVHFGDSFLDRNVKTADRKITGLQGRNVTYLAELKPETLSVSIDGTPMIDMQRSRSQPGVRGLHQPFKLVINLALGGAWAGPVDRQALPATMTIKAIRIWRWRPVDEKPDVTASKD